MARKIAIGHKKKINNDAKRQRDRVRDLIDDTREAYRPIRNHVDKVSDNRQIIKNR